MATGDDDEDIASYITRTRPSPTSAQVTNAIEKPMRLQIPDRARAPLSTAPSKLERRHFDSGAEITSTVAETYMSIYDIVIEAGSSAVAEVTLTGLPSQATVVSLPSVGEVTIPAAIPTQSTSITGSSTVGAASSSLTINVPSPSSQLVLSSPPSTPLPPTPSSTSSSPSLTSYFSTSKSSRTASSKPPATTLLSSTSFVGNSTTSTFTSTRSKTTITGTTVLPLTFLSSNSTRTASTHLATTSTVLRTTKASSITIASSVATTSQKTATSISTFETSTTSASGTGVIGGGGSPGTATGTAISSATASATTTAAAGSGGSSDVSTSTLVGGVVGGIAGLSIFLVILLFLIRMHRRRRRNREIGGASDTEAAEVDSTPGSSPMRSRLNAIPLAGPLIKRIRSPPAEPPPTERGFQNFGGRKIESVLASGGDGYGNPGPSGSVPASGIAAGGIASRSHTRLPPANAANTSFLRDSHDTTSTAGAFSPPGSPGLHELAASNPSGESGIGSRLSDTPEIVTMRPGPARTPVTAQGPFPSSAAPALPPQVRNSPRLAPVRDGVGRSLVEQDGSRGSRFAENVD
ncbi:hypothetical protein MMC25_000787 [Agyrium rufum]|nr:hypothetical protein [Agyrium rufum]